MQIAYMLSNFQHYSICLNINENNLFEKFGSIFSQVHLT